MDYEYKIIEGSSKDIQKTLNQWKHQYELEIISVNSYPDTFTDNDGRQRAWIVVTLKRIKK